MQNVNEPVQMDESLKVPQPPEQVVQDVQAEQEKQESAAVVTMPENNTTVPEKVQDMDWNNGRPEVSSEHVDPLPSHQTAEQANNEELRENKGNAEEEAPFEASEEVNTGQSAG